MKRVLPRDLHEAEQLLHEVRSWDKDEVEELPQFYREKARKYRQLLQPGKQ